MYTLRFLRPEVLNHILHDPLVSCYKCLVGTKTCRLWGYGPRWRTTALDYCEHKLFSKTLQLTLTKGHIMGFPATRAENTRKGNFHRISNCFRSLWSSTHSLIIYIFIYMHTCEMTRCGCEISCDVCHWGFFVIDCTDGDLKLSFGFNVVLTLNVNINKDCFFTLNCWLIVQLTWVYKFSLCQTFQSFFPLDKGSYFGANVHWLYLQSSRFCKYVFYDEYNVFLTLHTKQGNWCYCSQQKQNVLWCLV